MKILLILSLILLPVIGFAQQHENIAERQPPVVTVQKVEENEQMAQQERLKDIEERKAELQKQNKQQQVTSSNTVTKTASKKPEEQ